jgi:alkylated DNA repair dioxygenase AlkB
MNARAAIKAPTAALPQPDLFGAPQAELQGFHCETQIIDAVEEAALAGRMADLPFKPFDFHGHLARRHVVSFGLRYDYGSRRVLDAEPMPDWLLEIRDRVAAFAGRPPEAFVQALINRYAAGAGIGWHKDKPHFDEVVALSLLGPCTLRLRRRAGEGWARESHRIQPRSAYLLTGPARHVWEHSVPPVETLRYSLTFRTLVPPGERHI